MVLRRLLEVDEWLKKRDVENFILSGRRRSKDLFGFRLLSEEKDGAGQRMVQMEVCLSLALPKLITRVSPSQTSSS